MLEARSSLTVDSRPDYFIILNPYFHFLILLVGDNVHILRGINHQKWYRVFVVVVKRRRNGLRAGAMQELRAVSWVRRVPHAHLCMCCKGGLREGSAE